MLEVEESLNRAISARRLEREVLIRLDRRLEFALVHHRNTRGGRMEFQERPYLIAIYRDRSQTRVFKKAVQCGISESLIIDALEAASRGLACLYVMPTQEKRDKFVANRVSRAIRAASFYRDLVRSGPGRANSSGLKHFGPGVISFVGSHAENEFIEFPADFIIVDEFDRCDQVNMPLVRDRLAASPYKLAAFASTPTHTGAGVARLFDDSDAKEWFIRCQACGHAQPLDFFKNVVRRTGEDEYVLLDREWARAGGQLRRDVRVFCNRCRRPIDRLAGGEWVAKHPGRDVSGYHISQLFVATCKVAELWSDWQKSLKNDWERQRFYNSLLGEPYSAEGSGLSLEDLLACCRDYEMPKRAAACTMGVDVGEWMHVRISSHPEPGVRRAVFIGRVKTTDDLDHLIERYGVRCCVIDAQPEAHLVRKWQQSHPRGRIWRCTYSENDLRELRKDSRGCLARVARTASLDDATEDILMGRNWLPRNAETLDRGEFVEQMLGPIRELVTGPRGNKRYVWSKPAADHHRHADNYDKLASQLWQPTRTIKIVTGGDRRTFPRDPGRVFRAA